MKLKKAVFESKFSKIMLTILAVVLLLEIGVYVFYKYERDYFCNLANTKIQTLSNPVLADEFGPENLVCGILEDYARAGVEIDWQVKRELIFLLSCSYSKIAEFYREKLIEALPYMKEGREARLFVIKIGRAIIFSKIYAVLYEEMEIPSFEI